MLKITVHERTGGWRLQLEGKLAGPWVEELESCWKTAAPSLDKRTVCVDLTGVDYVDPAGRYLLALMYKEGARLVGSGCAASGIAHDIAAEWPARRQISKRRD